MNPTMRRSRTWDSIQDEGLSVLDVDPQNQAEASPTSGCDIVVLHGLNGHPLRSFIPTNKDPAKPDQQTWLVDRLLGYSPEGSRIMTFGYRSDQDLDGILSPCGIRRTAIQLLDEIIAKRREEHQMRPIVFLAHSYGGIIVKQALWIAEHESIYMPISTRTSMLVFLATPHRATKESTWENLAFRVICASFGQPIKQLYVDLSRNCAKAIERISNDFEIIIRKYPYILTCAESSDTPWLGSRVVDSTSSSLGTGNECSIPVLSSDVGTHQDMTKSPYTYLFDYFQWFCPNSISKIPAFSAGCLNCLQSLSILSPKTHLPTHVLTHDEAFKWVQNHEKYQEWATEQTTTFLYIRGRSGSGKTALSTFLAKKIRRVSSAVYFFFSREDEVRRRPEAALLSLTYQLLIHKPTLFAQVEDMYVQLVRESPNWRVKDTWSLFRAILCCAESPMTFIIDALNECECPEFLENLIKTHKDAKASCKFIVTSSRSPYDREQPDFVIDLDVEEEARKGTELFRESKTSDFIVEAPRYSGLKQQIGNQLDHAEQSFLGVKLALGHLSNLKKLSTPLFVEQELGLLRGGIEKTYARILEVVPPRIHQWARKALLWILYSFRPLEIGELAIALAVETSPPQIDNDQLSRDLSADLVDAFGPLIRIDNNKVHLVHPSTREFLLGERLDEAAWYRPNIQPHLDIARACVAYLATKEIQENRPFVQLDEAGLPRLAIPKMREFGLLNYVGQYWPQHYKAVGGSDNTPSPEGTFHERVSHMLTDTDQLQAWFDLHKLLAYAKQPFATCLSNLPFLLASQLGFLEVVKIYLQSQDPSMQETICLAMEIAAGSGNGVLMEILLQDPRAEVGWTNKGGQTILHVAALNGSADVVEKLLDKDGTDLAKVCNGSTALHLAAEGGSELVVKMLLNACADPNAVDFDGMVPLHLAAMKGHISVVEALLDGLALVDKRVQDGVGMTALHLAAKSGKDIVARKLLGRQAIIDTTKQGRTPLHIAAENGHKLVVKVILDSDPASIDAQDFTGATALYMAAERGHTEVLKILLELGKAKSDLKTEFERYTALHIAAKRGNTSAIKELVEHEADTNAQDKNRQTPLHTAALTGKLESVEALLRTGANPDATDLSRHTPLHCATMCGDLSVVRALLDGGAHQNATSSYGRTALHWAAWYGFSLVVKELVERGTDLERKDRAEWTALHYAYSETEAAKALLEAGADVDPTNTEGSTPLLLASQDPCVEVMKLLVNAKADPRIADNRKVTPLHKVSHLGNLEAVQILIRAGGSPCVASNVGTTPKKFAEERGDARIIDALKVVDKSVIDNTEDLALKCLNKNDFAGARDIREDLLKRAEEYLDAGDGLILGVMLNLASTYLESDDLEDAERLAKRILDESESIPDDEKPTNEREKANAILDSVREKREKLEQQTVPTCEPVESEARSDEGENKLCEPAAKLD